MFSSGAACSSTGSITQCTTSMVKVWEWRLVCLSRAIKDPKAAFMPSKPGYMPIDWAAVSGMPAATYMDLWGTHQATGQLQLGSISQGLLVRNPPEANQLILYSLAEPTLEDEMRVSNEAVAVSEGSKV